MLKRIKKSFYFKLSAHLRYYLEGDRPSQTNKLKSQYKPQLLILLNQKKIKWFFIDNICLPHSYITFNWFIFKFIVKVHRVFPSSCT